MHRFFIDPSRIVNGQAALSEEDSLHVLRVLRLKEGDTVIAADGAETEYTAEIAETGKKSVLLTLKEAVKPGTEPRTKITLYQGVPKTGKTETVVQKGTEIGVSVFVPFYSTRSVVKPGRDKGERYERVAYEAAKQSHRTAVPTVEAPITFTELCRRLPGHELVLAAWEEERALNVREALKGFEGTDVALIIGPEGGITPEEAEALSAAGARVVTLGPRILRTETAGTVLAALVLYELGDMR